jgi:hypothetical protein
MRRFQFVRQHRKAVQRIVLQFLGYVYPYSFNPPLLGGNALTKQIFMWAQTFQL